MKQRVFLLLLTRPFPPILALKLGKFKKYEGSTKKICKKYEGIREYMLLYTRVVGLENIPDLSAGREMGPNIPNFGGIPAKRHEICKKYPIGAGSILSKQRVFLLLLTRS